MKVVRAMLSVLAVVGVFVVADAASAQRPGGPGGPPSFDKLLELFDSNDDGVLEEDEVPPPVWQRLSQADANGDGYVTRAEFEAFRKKRGGGK